MRRVRVQGPGIIGPCWGSVLFSRRSSQRSFLTGPSIMQESPLQALAWSGLKHLMSSQPMSTRKKPSFYPIPYHSIPGHIPTSCAPPPSQNNIPPGPRTCASRSSLTTISLLPCPPFLFARYTRHGGTGTSTARSSAEYVDNMGVGAAVPQNRDR